MTTPRVNMVLLIGLCCIYGCAAPTPGPHANTVRPSREVTQPSTSTDDHGAEAGADARQATICYDKPIERVEEYWADGTLRLRQEVVIDEDGSQIPHGLTTRFWENGRKKLEMEFNCGIRDGLRLTWFGNGLPSSEGAFVDGKEHGLWTSWYSSGAKSQEFTMVHGAWHGTQTVWYANGQKKMEVEWVNGRRQGPLRIWDSRGKLLVQHDYVDNIAQPRPATYAQKTTEEE